jgi:hypothetical protein
MAAVSFSTTGCFLLLWFIITTNGFRPTINEFRPKHAGTPMFSSRDSAPLPLPRSVGESNRRRFLVFPSAIAAALAPLILAKKVVNAREGAFEMDTRFYIRALVGGGNVTASATEKRKAMFKSPRKLDAQFASAVGDVVCREISRISGVPMATIVTNVTNTVPTLIPSFQSYVPIREMNFSDQYWFDIYLYAAYLLAAAVIPLSADRVTLRKNVGNGILALLRDTKRVSLASPLAAPGTNEVVVAAGRMETLATGVESILKAFAELKLIDSYLFDAEDVGDQRYAEGSFTEGLPVSFQITMRAPATILGFLEVTASNSFFHPEILATTIASYARSLGFKAHFEDYLMDEYYLYDQSVNEVTAQDIIIELEVGTQSSKMPDF